MKKIIAFTFAIMVMTGLSGCANTLEGAGRDMKGAGQWMEDTF